MMMNEFNQSMLELADRNGIHLEKNCTGAAGCNHIVSTGCLRISSLQKKVGET